MAIQSGARLAVVVARQYREETGQKYEGEELRPELHLRSQRDRGQGENRKLDRRRRTGLGHAEHEQHYRGSAGQQFHQFQSGHAERVVERRHQDLAQPFMIAPQMTGRGVRVGIA